VGLFSSLFGGAKKKDAPEGLNKVKQVLAKRWSLRGRTGQGSMSKVFQGFDNNLGRNVALKLLDKDKTKRFEERFTSQGLKKPPEGEVCAALRHQNCVRTFEYGTTTENEPYLVMEWIDGLGLNYLIETRSPQLKGNRINYLGQLCDAIQYLHDAKYLHRDLCPRNVMVDKEGVVKLIDFGLTIPYTPAFCKPGNRTGTADYLAPEVIKRMTTDHRVDLFALGVTAYEVFTGLLPWERSPSSEETLRRHLNSPPRNPGDLNKELGEDVVKVLLKSISKEPQGRYSSAAAFKDALLALKRQDY
jgi:serine/threonine protein kinase